MRQKKMGNTLMYGAIIGDIVGSAYEFSPVFRNKPESFDFPLFSSSSAYTDDTIMTCAIASALLEKKDVSETMRQFSRDYVCQSGGYGTRFQDWLNNPKAEAYNSCGNGAGMRVSSVGYFAKNEDDCIRLSDKVTEVTHNHYEGMKAARVVSLLIYHSLQGKDLSYLRKIAVSNYNINFDLEELRKNYEHSEICQTSVPEALYCFLSSKNFEDCLRRVNYIGGDTDTIGAMACAIASAYYRSIPSFMIEECRKRLPSSLQQIIENVPLHLKDRE